jgi:hypothetical protein
LEQPGTGQITPVWVGLVPGQVGLYQINFVVPKTIPVGDQILNVVVGQHTMQIYGIISEMGFPRALMRWRLATGAWCWFWDKRAARHFYVAHPLQVSSWERLVPQ